MFTIAKRECGVHLIPKEVAAVPLLQVHLLKGRPQTVKAELVRELTDAVERVLGSSSERISVLVTEYSAGEWNVAGVPLDLPTGAVDD